MSENRLNWSYDPKDDGAIEIPVRVAAEAPAAEATANPAYDADEQVIREYEQRYFNMPDNTYMQAPAPHTEGKNGHNESDSSIWKRVRNLDVPPRHRYANRQAPKPKDDNDRLWAALAHGSAILTLLAFLGSGGPGVALGLLIPLGIYLFFRTRSEYVAFHALQAFTFQTVCTIGSVVAIIAVLGMLIVSAIASIFLIGIPFAILFALLLVATAMLAIFNVFVFMPVYSMSAAFSTFNGRGFRYPWVADWVDDQLTNGKVQPTIV